MLQIVAQCSVIISIKVLMTYQAHDKPKCHSFSSIISFCNNLLPSYQNLCLKCTQWLGRDARASFRERGLEGSTNSHGFTIVVFFAVNCTSCKCCYCAKTICYADQDPQGSLRPQQFTEMMPDMTPWLTVALTIN